uniref:Uncharacterized protein n=1 Tax=Solanum tuberosum TaxID=4113 RepID=M1DK81_SOLTU
MINAAVFARFRVRMMRVRALREKRRRRRRSKVRRDRRGFRRGCDFELNLLYVEGFNDYECLGKESLLLRGFRVGETKEESHFLGKNGGASRQPARPNRGSEVPSLGRRAMQSAPTAPLKS